VRIDFLNHFSLQGLYIEDQAHDTLLYAGEAQMRITDWFIWKDKPVLHYLALNNTYIHLYRTSASSDWNYDFVAKAFATNATSKSKDTSKVAEFDLEKVALNNVRFHFDDSWVGEDLDFDIGSLALDAKQLDFKKRLVEVNSIVIDKAAVGIKEYVGGRPHHTLVDTIDRSPFNGDNWSIKVKDVKVDNSMFSLTGNNRTPVPDLFDENHLVIRNISAAVTNGAITGDTITGKLTHLTAHERCGLAIMNMRSDISVSPVASICSNLYLETNHSKVQNYYAMHYSRFPCFLDYIDSVTMVGRMDNSTVDSRDLAYFAPELKSLPAVLQVSGNGHGTVSNLAGSHLNITNGSTVIRGNVVMKGLPDIYKTHIIFDNGELYTTGDGMLKYATQLRNSPYVDVAQLSHVYFKGSYDGYIENFLVNGMFTTNLGTVSTNIRMSVPGFNADKATYSGSIATGDFQIGRLLKQPLIGNITCKENISGISFDPENAQLKVDGTVNRFGVNGYDYSSIVTRGTLEKKEFDGTLIVDDTNLALEFDGNLDYRGKDIKLNATAHLLYSNLKALNFTRDSVTTAADFDLRCEGNNIDDFLGQARLYNIDLKRHAHKVAVDSVNLRSALTASGDKELVVESNDIVASVKGKYQLSKLPVSVQFFLSKYIPNYISVPVVFPPAQDFTFSIKTRNIDSILAVSFNGVKGFDTATVTGSLNTDDQKVTLSADVPSATLGMFHMHNISVSAQGNLDQLELNTSIENVAVGDSIFNSTLSVTTTVANDSLNFTIATTAPDTSSAITLNGHIIARQDSLFLSILPSEFYLNRTRWDIPGGSKVVYADHYLDVEGIVLSSGLQRVTANTRLSNQDQSLVIASENLDLSQAGALAGMSAYQPDGRLNGVITVDKIFRQVYVSANMQATGVKLGNDTVGTINLIGFYDGSKKLISLDPQTGIYKDNASLVAAGAMSFDSTSSQLLDGKITFNNAPAAWSSPFLTGIFSHITGAVNGEVDFNGYSDAPKISGTLTLTNAGLKVDYLGVGYSIPLAVVTVDEKRINFGKVELFDGSKNKAILTGHFSHNAFRDMRMHVNVSSPRLEVLNLTASDNNIFYGKLTAGIDSFTVRGPFNNIRLHAYNAYPADKSHIYMPVSSATDVGSYSYVSFKAYGKSQEKPIIRSHDKLQINIDANFNELAEMTIVMDPSTGDEITTKGEGSVQLEIPPSTDMSITGVYNIHSGTYTFTLKQLEYRRQFLLNNGTINFRGPFMATGLDVDATYSLKTRLYDILDDKEKSVLSPSETEDAQALQPVNVLLHMAGTLKSPELTFNLDLPEKRSTGTYAYTKLNRINQDAQQKFDEVGALLLIGTFIPSEGLGNAGATGTVGTLALNNVSSVLSSTASQGLTNIIKRLSGNDDFNIDVKYNNYNYDLGTAAANRNQVKFNLSRSFFNQRLSVEVGSTSDWGRPTSASSTSNFNITGDFRVQYALAKASNLRLNAFRTSDYDVTLDKNISRAGVGLSWRKSFDDLSDFFHGYKYAQQQKEAQQSLSDTTK